MSRIFEDDITLWAALLIVALPVLIIIAGEAQERLRQRGSVLEHPVATIRNWVLPLAAAWALIVLVFEADSESIVVQVLSTALIIATTVASVQILRWAADRARERSLIPGVRRIPELLLTLPRLIVFLVAGWILFDTIWNVDLTGLLAALGVSSLIISLALQPTLSGLASGLLLLADKPFDPGDWIKVEDLEGEVVDISWRTSQIKNRQGDIVVVPNSTLSDATIVNFAEPSQLHRVSVSLQVAYSNPPTRAIEMLLAAARATEGVLEDPAPAVRVVSIDDPLMGYEAQMWIDDYEIAPRVRSDFGALVWYQSHRMDVPLPSPAFDLFHHDPIQEAVDAELSTSDLADRLRLAPVLAPLSDEDLDELAAAAHSETYREGELILQSGSTDRDSYIMWQGRARIVATAHAGRYIDLGPGEVFGAMSRPSREEDAPAVVALTDCEVVVVDADTAGAVASRNPTVIEALNKIMTLRNRRFQAESGEVSVAMFGAETQEDTHEDEHGDRSGP